MSKAGGAAIFSTLFKKSEGKDNVSSKVLMGVPSWSSG